MVTEVTVRILRKPATQRALLVGFDTVQEGGQAVSDVIAAGIIPAGMEMMDNPAINAAEDFVNAGYPREAAALLIIELDGPEAEVDVLIKRVSEIVKASGASSIRISQSEEERNQFWAAENLHFRL